MSDEPETPIPDGIADERPSHERRQPAVGNVLYCWQMQVEGGWNIIAMGTGTGVSMPLVTTSMPLAWEAFEVAQAHANRNQCQVRLAMFNFDTVAAIVDPND